MALTEHQGKTVVGFMDLATETRLEIYGWLFKRSKHDLHACCPQAYLPVIMAVEDVRIKDRKRTTETIVCPSVSSKFTTAVLRVSKKIYDEALPVMLDNLNYVVRDGRCAGDGCYVTLEDLCEMTIAGRVRSLAFTTTLERVAPKG